VIATYWCFVAALLGSNKAVDRAMGGGAASWLALLQLSSLTSVFARIDDRRAEARRLGRDWRLE
jgi:hypothetical protein